MGLLHTTLGLRCLATNGAHSKRSVRGISDRAGASIIAWVAVVTVQLGCLPTTVAQIGFDPYPEQRFAESLERRGLPELAVMWLERQADYNEAHRGRLLAEIINIRQQQAWFAGRADRSVIYRTAIAEATESIASGTLTARDEIRLRLGQIELAVSAVCSRRVVASALYPLCCPLLFPQLPQPPDTLQDSEETARKLVQNEQQALEELDQLQAAVSAAETFLRGDSATLDRAVRRRLQADVLRLKVRILYEQTCQVSLMEIRTRRPQALRQRLQKEALEAAEKAVRFSESIAAEVLDYAVHLALSAGDLQQAELYLRRRAGLAEYPASAASQRNLELLKKLADRDITGAAEQLGRMGVTEPLASGADAVIALQIRLAFFFVVDQLNRPALLQDAAAAFLSTAQTASGVCRGVEREVADQLVQQFHLVADVGLEAAGVLPEAERRLNAGLKDSALLLLQSALAKLSESASVRSRAVLTSRLGRLHRENGNWSRAEAYCGEAEKYYLQAGMDDSAAAAHLQSLFAVSRRWSAALADGEDQISAQLVSAYEQGLVKHRGRYRQQATWEAATEWLILLRNYQGEQTLPLQLELLEALPGSDKFRQRLSTATNDVWIPSKPDVQSASAVLPIFSEAPVGTEITARWEELCRTAALGEDTKETDRILAGLCLLRFRQEWLFDRVPAAAPMDGLDGRENAVAAELLRGQSLLPAIREFIRTACSDAAPEELREAVQGLLNRTAADRLMAGAVLLNHAKTLAGPGPTDDADLTLCEQRLSRLGRKLILDFDPLKTPPGDVLAALARVRTGSDSEEALLTAGDWNVLLERPDFSKAQRSQLLASMTGENGTSAQGVEALELRMQAFRSAPRGSAAYFEAAVRLAESLVTADRPAEALQLLEVVEVLYPDWGNSVRRARVEELRRELQAK